MPENTCRSTVSEVPRPALTAPTTFAGYLNLCSSSFWCLVWIWASWLHHVYIRKYIIKCIQITIIEPITRNYFYSSKTTSIKCPEKVSIHLGLIKKYCDLRSASHLWLKIIGSFADQVVSIFTYWLRMTICFHDDRKQLVCHQYVDVQNTSNEDA